MQRLSLENKKLIENIIALGALQIVSYIIPMINLPYLSRVLGADKFGLVFFAFAVMQYFIILSDFGFNLSATREIAVNRHNQNNLSNIFSSVIFSKFLLIIISFCILLLCILFFPKFHSEWQIFLLSFLMVVGNALYPVWFFQGMERMKYITFLKILAHIIFLLLIFVFVKDENDYMVVPLLNSMGFIISGLLGIFIAIRNFGIKLYKPKLFSLKKQLKYSAEFFLSRISVSIMSNTNSVCLGLIGSNISVGFYVAAEKISQAIDGIQSPLIQALYPFVAKNKNIKLFKKIFYLMLFIYTLIGIFIFVFAKDIIVIFYGQHMEDAYKVLRIFVFAFTLNAPVVLLGYPLLGGLGYTNIANKSVIISSIFHLCGLLILFLTKNLNIYSIAWLCVLNVLVTLSIRLGATIRYKLFSTHEGVKNV